VLGHTHKQSSWSLTQVYAEIQEGEGELRLFSPPNQIVANTAPSSHQTSKSQWKCSWKCRAQRPGSAIRCRSHAVADSRARRYGHIEIISIGLTYSSSPTRADRDVGTPGWNYTFHSPTSLMTPREMPRNRLHTTGGVSYVAYS
jgi:hypothetical protein